MIVWDPIRFDIGTHHLFRRHPLLSLLDSCSDHLILIVLVSAIIIGIGEMRQRVMINVFFKISSLIVSTLPVSFLPFAIMHRQDSVIVIG